MFPLVATLWYPDSNPIAVASLLPLAVVVGVAAIQSHFREIALTTPAIFMALTAYSIVFRERFEDAAEIIGYYIWNLAACSFAWEVARSGSRDSLIYGGFVVLLMGWLLIVETTARLSELLGGNLSTPQILFASSVVWCVLFVMLMHRAAQPYRRASRIARGLCGRCGYDMRESPQRCPECGEQVARQPSRGTDVTAS